MNYTINDSSTAGDNWTADYPEPTYTYTYWWLRWTTCIHCNTAFQDYGYTYCPYCGNKLYIESMPANRVEEIIKKLNDIKKILKKLKKE